ncbi:MAG: deoxyribose-phosphate aldolase [Paenibacillaceae bacterium]|jgi:deoxyribose-phosphate aldolase|nr:deoxyribose-phosphate aldolase [Paenibacillaceae bacterium]
MGEGIAGDAGSAAFLPDRLPAYIDHTLLKPEAGAAAVERLCEEAAQFRFYSVCVNGVWVALCSRLLAGTGVKVSAVCGFPLGAAVTGVKAYEAEQAVAAGASEIDMVLPVGKLIDGDEAAVRDDIAAVVAAAGDGTIVKVIMETGLLTDSQKVTACRLAVEAGAHFVKTSTGFGPGGATVDDVRLLRANVPAGMGVKASGGIRDLDAALAMIAAGATRLGTSAGVAIMQGVAAAGGSGAGGAGAGGAGGY